MKDIWMKYLHSTDKGTDLCEQWLSTMFFPAALFDITTLMALYFHWEIRVQILA